jgi:hypothetical protein
VACGATRLPFLVSQPRGGPDYPFPAKKDGVRVSSPLTSSDFEVSNAMTPTAPVRVGFEAFCLCVSAAQAAGWDDERAAFDAVTYMLSGGLTARGIVLLFLDAKTRVQ